MYSVTSASWPCVRAPIAILKTVYMCAVMILDILKRHWLFNVLDDAQLQTLSKAFFTETYSQGSLFAPRKRSMRGESR